MFPSRTCIGLSIEATVVIVVKLPTEVQKDASGSDNLRPASSIYRYIAITA
jgi:hypothetical protein